jgi:hypothetical protein
MIDFQAIHAIAHKSTSKEIVGTDPLKLHERRMMRMHEAQRRAGIYNRAMDRKAAREATNTAEDQRQERRTADMSHQFATRSNAAHAARQQAAADRLKEEMAPKRAEAAPAPASGRRARTAAPAPSEPSTPMPLFRPAHAEPASGTPTRSLLPPPQATFHAPQQFSPASPSPRLPRPTEPAAPSPAATDPMFSRSAQAPLSAERTAAEGLNTMQFSKPRRKAPRSTT